MLSIKWLPGGACWLSWNHLWDKGKDDQKLLAMKSPAHRTVFPVHAILWDKNALHPTKGLIPTCVIIVCLGMYSFPSQHFITLLLCVKCCYLHYNLASQEHWLVLYQVLYLAYVNMHKSIHEFRERKKDRMGKETKSPITSSLGWMQLFLFHLLALP